MNPSVPNDRDRDLASRMGAGELPDSGQDAVVRALEDVRAAYQNEDLPAGTSARLWARIERGTRLGTERPRPVLRLVWGAVSVAAAVALLVIVPRLFSPASGQLLAQAADAQVWYEADDGSRVLLRPNSRLFALDVDSYRLEGEAYFQVTHDPSRTFSVQGTHGRVDVLGTTFNMRAIAEETAVYLEKGRVRFSTEDGDQVLEPGQLALFVEASGLQPVTPTSGHEELDWVEGTLVFESRPAWRIARELEQHFGVRLGLPAVVEEETVSGTLMLESAEGALNDFAMVLGGRFVESGEGLRFIIQ